MPSRLDRELANRGLARSRSHARQLLDSGVVRLNGHACQKPSWPVADSDQIWLTATDSYVSRAAHKLLGALDDLCVPVGSRALDAGSSTGGFSQVLLERGCQLLYAVDVGRNQLDSRLRSDPRVRTHEGFNLRELGLDLVDGQPVDLVVADVSFISLRKLVHPLIGVLRADGDLLTLIKPQFELGPHDMGRDGVVRSPQLRRRAVSDVIDAAADAGWRPRGIVPSRAQVRSGNREFFVHFTAGGAGGIAGPDTWAWETVDWT